MKTILAAFVVLSLAMPGAALAQDAAAQTDDANAPTDSHVAAAIDLLKSNHFTDNIQAMLDAIQPLETQSIKRAAPALSDDEVVALETILRQEITSRQDELMRLEAVEYCRHFNEQELHDLAAFYRSPVGQKYISTIPTLLRESSPIMQQWMLGVVAQSQGRILQSIHKQPANKS